jgi:hypothetical protein
MAYSITSGPDRENPVAIDCNKASQPGSKDIAIGTSGPDRENPGAVDFNRASQPDREGKQESMAIECLSSVQENPACHSNSWE